MNIMMVIPVAQRSHIRWCQLTEATAKTREKLDFPNDL